MSARPMRVAVFRALVLGDLLCATPALRALRSGIPGASITLIGLPWARALAQRLDSVDDFIEFPGWPGLPERPVADAGELPRFLAQVQAQRFDLAVQMHGSGSIVNPLVAAFGARRTAGFADAQAWRPPADAERYAAWPEQGTEVERLLSLTDHLGLPRQGTALDFPLTDDDRRGIEPLIAEAKGRSLALVHAGSQLPSRRWPAERFAAVADTLWAQGFAVLLTGSAGESAITAAVSSRMRHPAVDLAGCTSLWELGALVERAAVVVSNDTGISHIAAALRRPSVVVASGSDVRRWSPADRTLHRVFWHDLPCRPCAHAVCPIGHACALGVETQEVQRAAVAAAAHA